MNYNFDWNYVAAGAPYVTISELAIDQGDTWVVERRRKGIASGPNALFYFARPADTGI